ncbi:hypothetical protein [Actinospica sp.]|jgi:hypothetical protein|uniref:hypothetical protein n=1 Tax=Actinospica sp. TaxID=1872142 RepID=UPI002C96044A|nr:hypothetical protein [Actinospica sp.]HWG24021.1 hypothetical protein [Actinospica sp.]
MDVANIGVTTPTTPGTLEDTVAGVEAELTQAQIDLEHTRSQLDHLTRQQHSQLGPLYDQLDQLDLDIAGLRATITGDPEDLRRLQQLYGTTEQAADPLTDPLPEPAPAIDPEYASTLRFTEPEETPAEAQPSPAKVAQRLYRDLARRAHPDLVQDPVEQERRSAFIARVNDAYRRLDLYELQRLAEEWAVLNNVGPGDPTVRQLWLRQRMIWLKARLAESRVERETLLSSPIGQVLLEVGAAQVLEVLGSRLHEQINMKEQQLNLLRQQLLMPR